MKIDGFSFGFVRIDGTVYENDVVIDNGAVRKRDKNPSRKFRGDYGYTPLSVEEDIPGIAAVWSSAPAWTENCPCCQK
jgi:hypothetical protein